MFDYYTYVLIDPRNCQPFYVGKGKGQRMYHHWSHRHSKNIKNNALKSRLCEMQALNIRPVYIKVLEQVTHELAIAKEIELIAQYGRLDLGTGGLCNLTKGGDGRTGWSTSDREIKSKHELSKKKGKPVSQYSLSGDFISTFSSSKVASEAVLTANRSYITQCCKKKRRSAGGFLWAYADEVIPKYTHSRCPPVFQYSREGTLITKYVNSSEAAKRTGTKARYITLACKGKTKTCAGFIWKYY